MPYQTQKLRRRLTEQLRGKGVDRATYVADAILKQRGHLNTKAGKVRENLGNEGRAKDRAVKSGGGKPSDYVYNPKTNLTRRKK